MHAGHIGTNESQPLCRPATAFSFIEMNEHRLPILIYIYTKSNEKAFANVDCVRARKVLCGAGAAATAVAALAQCDEERKLI